MSVVLINAPWKEGYNRCGRWGGRTVSLSRNPPVYFLYIGAILEALNCGVAVIDASAENLDINHLVERVEKLSPILAVIETNCASLEADLECAEAVKAVVPYVGLCGLMATTFGAALLQKDFVDLCFIGEYDYTVPIALHALTHGCSIPEGVSVKRNGKLHVGQKHSYINVECLPYPAYHLVKNDLYDEIIIRNRPYVQSIESRSCPYNCSFCISHIMFGRGWRAMSPKRVVDEMEHWEKKGMKEVFWDGETFTVDKLRCLEICRLIKERGLKVKWSCLSRADTVDEKTLNAMADANCVQIRFGFESASQKVLDYIRKGYRVEQIVNSARWARDANILVHGAWMFVPPVESEASIADTISLAEKTCDTAQFTICTPYPGTDFYNDCKRDGLLLTEDWSLYLASERSVVKTDLDLNKAVKTAYRSFYGRPSFVVSSFFNELRKGTLGKALRVGKNIFWGGFW